MIQAYWLDARDKPGLLVRLMKFLTGSARIMLQRNLSNCDFRSIPGSQNSDLAPLHPMTGPNEGPHVVLTLESDTVQPILEQVLPHGRIVREIEHIQIEKNGELQFMAGDNFHNECISVGPGVPEAFLKELVSCGILRGFKTDTVAKAEWKGRAQPATPR